MTYPDLLDALERALGASGKDDICHHLPPAHPQVATAKPLTEHDLCHLCHFRHQDYVNSVEDDRIQVDRAASSDAADKRSAIQPRLSLLKEIGGKGGELLKTNADAMAYLSPPALEAVADGGKSGKRPGAEPTLLAHLDEALHRHQPAASVVPLPGVFARRHDRLSRWLSRHPPPACPPDQCSHCGGTIGERAKDAVPVLRSLRPAEPIWLHLTCSYDWYEGRLAAATAALVDEAAVDGERP